MAAIKKHFILPQSNQSKNKIYDIINTFEDAAVQSDHNNFPSSDWLGMEY